MSGRSPARPRARSKARSGRPAGHTTPAIARAARKNGENGGRPTAKLPAELLAELGAPPDDVLKKDAWWSRLIEVLMLGVAKGEPWKSMLEVAIRAASIATKSYEREVKARVAELLEREERETAADVSPPMVERGKDPIASSQRGAIRRDPA